MVKSNKLYRHCNYLLSCVQISSKLIFGIIKIISIKITKDLSVISIKVRFSILNNTTDRCGTPQDTREGLKYALLILTIIAFNLNNVLAMRNQSWNCLQVSLTKICCNRLVSLNYHEYYDNYLENQRLKFEKSLNILIFNMRHTYMPFSPFQFCSAGS